MAKRTAIIDIGSNSVRMVVFERSSRFGFHLINETKSRVRISEGAYNNDGQLQPEAINMAISALKQFLTIAKSFKVRKTLCIATSAVRDAPNKKLFLKRAEVELGLKIKVIDGKKEAWLGGVAAINLLPVTDGITIDIGGGSTELALIQNRRIVETLSLDIGTVRLKELFFDQNQSIKEAKEFIDSTLSKIPVTFKSKQIIGIGGTIRAIAKAIMQHNDHPIKKIHAFNFSVCNESKFIQEIFKSNASKLKKIGIKKDRLDTIKPGTLIFWSLLEKMDAKDVIISGAGIREGMFLSDLLRNSNHLFPHNFNPSIRNLQDRFLIDKKFATNISSTAEAIFNALQKPFGLPDSTKKYIKIATKLSQIGIEIDFYEYHKHSSYMIINSLNYGFTHEEMALIATLINFNKQKSLKKSFAHQFKKLLPDYKTLSLLSFIVSLAQTIHFNRAMGKVNITYSSGVLNIDTPFDNYLAKERIKELKSPMPITILFS